MAERVPGKSEIPKDIAKKIPNWMALSHKSFDAMTVITKALLDKEDLSYYGLEPIVSYLKPGRPFDRGYVNGRLDSVAKALAAEENGKSLKTGSANPFKDLEAVKVDLKGLAIANMQAGMQSSGKKSVYKMWIQAVGYYKNFKTQTMSDAECEDWVVEIIALEEGYKRYLELFQNQRKAVGEETAPK